MTILIPIWWRDKDRVPDTIRHLKKHMQIDKIIFVGPEAMREYIQEDDLVEYVDGNTIIPGMSRESIEEIIKDAQRKAGVKEDTCRAGWLLQQFIKLGFARYSDVSEYFVWDADVLMLNDFELHSKNKPKFFLYDRHMHIEYLPTIKSLLGDDIKPQGEYTFVNHYMLFESRLVESMLSEIEQNDSVEGDTWWEKCIRAIPSKDLVLSGFSEFETYGEYVICKHPDAYEFEYDYNHLLCTKRYFGEYVPENRIDWLSHDYYTIGFEGYDEPNKYWMNKADKAFAQGKPFINVEMADYKRQKLMGYVQAVKRKLKL